MESAVDDGRFPLSKVVERVVMQTAGWISRFVHDEEAQDLVEYGFLVAFVSLIAAFGWIAVRNAIATGYVTFDTAEQNRWEPPNPG